MGFEFGARGFNPVPRQPPAPQVQVLAPSRRQQRLYEAAIQNRLTANWVTTSTSADAEINGSLVRARNASRQLRRDNPYYAQAIRVITNNVIGRGIRFQSRVKMQQGNGQIDSNLRRQIEAWWKDYTRKEHIHVAGKLSLARILRQCVDAAVESGEVFIRLVPESFGGSTTPLGIEIIESDYCDEGHTTGRLSDGTQWRMGVHVDKWNRPIAYRFRTSHPGDVAGSTGYETVDIPASEIIHLYIQDRPGQTRGMPWLVAGMKRLHHLDGFEMAEVIGKRARSSLMGFIETPEPETLTDDVFAGDRVTVFEPGTFKTLAPGERVTVPQLGSDESDYEPFLRCMLRGLSAASAVPYPALSSDYSTANYSSSRLERLEVLPYWRFLQDWIIEDVCTPINERAMGAAVAAGTLPLVGYETMFRRYQECRWYPRGWEFVDPQKEVLANKDAVRAGFTTQTAIVAESYGDIEEMMDERQQELAMAQARGIILDTNPGQVSNAGLTQARPPGSIIPQDPWAPSDTAAETDSTDSPGEVEDTPEDTAEDAAEGEELN
jgi:lambda family phage portal protein